MLESSKASIRSRFSSPGMPKMYSTPSFSRHLTKSCAAFNSLGCRRFAAVALLLHQHVDNFEHFLVTTRQTGRSAVLAVYHQRGYTSNAIDIPRLLGTIGLGDHSKRIKGFIKFLRRYASLNKKCLYIGSATQGLLFLVESFKQRRMNFIGYVEQFRRIESACAQLPGRAKYSRHTHKGHVFRLGLKPRCYFRFHLVAVRAAIPEQFQNFYGTGIS